MGVSFLRFSEQQIRKDMDIVLKVIEQYISEYEKLNQLPRNKLVYRNHQI